jgi:hypothetical protein
MIHYHGTPIGGARVDAARFLRGRHALIPYAHRQDLEIAFEVCQSVLFDNSAYTTWRKGQLSSPPELDAWAKDYARWCSEWSRHPAYDGCLAPDVVDGDEATNDALLANWPARELRAWPVWHLHESLDRLARLCDEWPTVALGSSGRWATPGTDAWWRRMAQAMEVACDEEGRPVARLHGLRMLDPTIFTRLPLASADSTNAAVNSGSLSRFGQYKPPTAAQRAEVIAARIEAHTSAPVWRGGGQVDMFALKAVNE